MGDLTLTKFIKFVVLLIFCGFIIITTLYFTNNRTDVNNFTTDVEIPLETRNPNPDFEEIVYVTYSGTKYHKRSCEFILGYSIKSYKKSQAEELGFEPCYKCMQDN